MAITLSMMPKSPWGGLTPDEGGIIIVKDDGEVVCFHLYESSNLENYIFDNTKLDTPSSSRHNFGYIYEENGSQFMKLNLQIRFLK
jgi:type II restriction enzyme